MQKAGLALGLVPVAVLFVAAAGCYGGESFILELKGKNPPSALSDAGPPPECVPSDNSSVASDECGVFVSQSMAGADDSNPGTKEKPVKTVGKALELAALRTTKAVVYVCAENEAFEEPITVSGVTIFGGLDCTDEQNRWAYVGSTKKTMITAPEGQTPLRLDNSAGAVEIRDLHVIAKDVTAFGGSSIAAIAANADLSVVDSILEAGRAGAGEQGMTSSEEATKGNDGTKGENACSALSVSGGLSLETTCGDGSTSVGGLGGKSIATQGSAGTSGLPSGTSNGGQGQVTDASMCSPGLDGDDGAIGNPGIDAQGLGTIDAKGYTGVVGGDGEPGKPGQGGGGGGGAKGGTGAGKCPVVGMDGGSAGGSGASGGCGGAGGKGGQYGGSSIALVALNAKLSFRGTKIIAGDGGAAGAGGAGTPGGSGGMKGGEPGAVTGSLKPGCAGGRGGTGGAGGTGGRGTAGHSIGIAYKGSELQLPSPEQATFQLGTVAEGAKSTELQQF